MRKIHIWTLLALLFSVVSCFKDANFEAGFSGQDSGTRTYPERSQSIPDRRVMIMVSAGYNSLYSYLANDLQDLETGYLPEGKYLNSDVLLVLARHPVRSGDYSTPSAPLLYRLYKDRSGEVVRDTLKTWSGDTQLCTEETLRDALSWIGMKFPATGYGMVFSSHASGWLPSGYYSDPENYETSHASYSAKSRRGVREVFPPIDPYPAVKSLGQDKTAAGGVEFELKEFADAIPFHLDYLLIDACLSGCVEVAYALRDKADIVGFSPAEVLAEGFNYVEIASRLLNGEPDPVGVCEEYFAYYDSQTGSNRSATITAVDTRKLDQLANVCKELFEKYRTAVRTLDGNRVQGYFRFNRHFFYDLKDILVQAGISAQEEARLDAALDACILYKAATPYFLTIPIQRYCGLTMYLPSMGTDYLDSFYKENMAWNEATELVK